MKRQIEIYKVKLRHLLKWSEKYTKTNMVYLARGGFWLSAGQVVTATSSFFISIAFANLIPRETYGIYKYVLSIAGILSITTLAGINTALIQGVARGYEGSVIQSTKTRIRWGILGSVASLTTAVYYLTHGNYNLALAFLIVSFFVPILDSFSVYDSLLQGRKQFDKSAKFGAMGQTISAIILVGTLLITKNVLIILFVYFAVWTIVRFIFFKISISKENPNNVIDPQTIPYGKHLSLMGVVGTIAGYIDRLLVFHFLGAAELAVYSLATAPPEQIKGFMKNIKVLALPKFSEKTKEEIRGSLAGKAVKLFIFTVVIAVIYILAAPFFFKIFFPQYLDSVFYSQIFAISLIATINMLPSSVLQSQMAKKELYIYNVCELSIQIILLLTLTYYFGLMGTIVARVITRMFSLFISFWLVKKL